MGPQDSREDLLAKAEGLRKEGPRTPGFRERLHALLQEAKARWESLSPEERKQLLALLGGLLALLPWGRLGRMGVLLQKAASPQAQVLLRLALKLLKR